VPRALRPGNVPSSGNIRHPAAGRGAIAKIATPLAMTGDLHCAPADTSAARPA
jgi:hypothetical protein